MSIHVSILIREPLRIQISPNQVHESVEMIIKPNHQIKNNSLLRSRKYKSRCLFNEKSPNSEQTSINPFITSQLQFLNVGSFLLQCHLLRPFHFLLASLQIFLGLAFPLGFAEMEAVLVFKHLFDHVRNLVFQLLSLLNVPEYELVLVPEVNVDLDDRVICLQNVKLFEVVAYLFEVSLGNAFLGEGDSPFPLEL